MDACTNYQIRIRTSAFNKWNYSPSSHRYFKRVDNLMKAQKYFSKIQIHEFLTFFGPFLVTWNGFCGFIEFQRLFFVISCLSLCLQTNPDVCLLLQKTRSKVRDSSRTKNRTTQISIKVYWIFEERRKKTWAAHLLFW